MSEYYDPEKVTVSIGGVEVKGFGRDLPWSVNLVEQPRKNHLFFDTETNGLPADWSASYRAVDNWPGILQLAWALTDEQGKEIHRANDLIKIPADTPLDPGAQAVHGLSREKLEAGISISQALHKFGLALDQADVIIAHNINFDRRIVQAELWRIDQQVSIAALNNLPQICTMQRSTNFCQLPGSRRGYKWPNLSELHRKLFNEGFAGAHDAMVDVEALMRCFWALKEKGVL